MAKKLNDVPAATALELVRGGARVRYFTFCVSIVVLSFRRSSPVYVITADESPFVVGLPWLLISLVAGWWGIPWGPIFTIQSLVTYLEGGKDLTDKLRSG